MSENFKEFLKRTSLPAEKHGKFRSVNVGSAILIKDLGEWAWQECYKYCAKEASPKMKLDFLKEVHPVLLEIAIACLGKRKIKLLLHY